MNGDEKGGIFAGVYADRARTRRWLRQPEGAAFHQLLVEWRQFQLERMATTADPEVHRHQGAFRILDRLVALADELESVPESEATNDVVEHKEGRTTGKAA